MYSVVIVQSFCDSLNYDLLNNLLQLTCKIFIDCEELHGAVVNYVCVCSCALTFCSQIMQMTNGIVCM